MKFGNFVFAFALACAGCAMAETPPMPGQPGAGDVAGGNGGGQLSADSSVDEILDALDRRGRDLKSFTADVRLTETDDTTALSSTRAGAVAFQNKGDGDARMRVVFDTKEDGSRQFDEKLEYVLDNGWLIDRNYKKRIEVRRQVLKPGEKVNLLRLGEGPFPLPIGQKKQDVHEQFDVEKVAPAEGDPPSTVHLRLSPKKGTDLAKRFSAIDVWVDPKSEMPSRIDTLDANEAVSRSTELTNLRVNPELT